MAGIYDFKAKSLAGEDIPLKRFEGQVLLIVNTASACGFTPQYQGLEALHQAFARAAFRFSDFPATSSAARNRAMPGRSSNSAPATMPSPFRCLPRSTSMAAWRHPLYQYLKSAKSGLLGLVDQMEFHQIPGRSFGQGGGAACADRQTRRTDKRNRGAAVNEKNRKTTGRPTARPSFDRSEKPLLQCRGARARRRHPLQGRREDQCRGILRQRGLGARRRRQCEGSLRQSADDQGSRPGRAVFPGQGAS